MAGPPWHIGHRTTVVEWKSLTALSSLANVVILMRVPHALHWTEYGAMEGPRLIPFRPQLVGALPDPIPDWDRKGTHSLKVLFHLDNRNTGEREKSGARYPTPGTGRSRFAGKGFPEPGIGLVAALPRGRAARDVSDLKEWPNAANRGGGEGRSSGQPDRPFLASYCGMTFKPSACTRTPTSSTAAPSWRRCPRGATFERYLGFGAPGLHSNPRTSSVEESMSLTDSSGSVLSQMGQRTESPPLTALTEPWAFRVAVTVTRVSHTLQATISRYGAMKCPRARIVRPRDLLPQYRETGREAVVGP